MDFTEAQSLIHATSNTNTEASGCTGNDNGYEQSDTVKETKTLPSSPTKNVGAATDPSISSVLDPSSPIPVDRCGRSLAELNEETCNDGLQQAGVISPSEQLQGQSIPALPALINQQSMNSATATTTTTTTAPNSTIKQNVASLETTTQAAALSSSWKSKNRDDLLQTVQVTFDLDSLTTTQMRMILARISKTHPNVIASSFSHVLGLLSGIDIKAHGETVPTINPGMTQSATNNTSATAATITEYAQESNMIIPTPNVITNTTTATSPPAQSYPIQYEVVVKQQDDLGYQNMNNSSSKKQKRQRSANKEKTVARTWEDRFQQLLKFKMTNGHLKLRRGSHEDPILGQWCSNQRAFYNMLKNGKKPVKITQQRIEKLNNIGFPWSVA